MKKLIIVTVLMTNILAFTSCTSDDNKQSEYELNSINVIEDKNSDNNTDNNEDIEENKENEKTEIEEAKIEEAEILDFVDVYGKQYQVEINPNIAPKKYDDKLFVFDGDILTYDDETYTYRSGVDVSGHQGYIDWQEVKAAGFEFAIIRLGYRGYGTTGSLNVDVEFERNVKNAKAAGLDVGVYFFAQAINEEEAKEEARFVIDNLNGINLDLPVVYDPESILDDVARTDNVTGEQFTKNTIAFCEEIKNAGYDPMVYSNMLWEAYKLDLEQLSDYRIWYADYEPHPQTPYDFEFWQYTNEAQVNGISGNSDLNIQLIKK